MRNEAVFTVQRAAEAGFAPDCIDPQLHALELKCSPDLVIHLPHLFVKLHDPGGDHRQPDYDQHDAAKDGACGGSDDGGGTVAAASLDQLFHFQFLSFFLPDSLLRFCNFRTAKI